MIFRHKAPFLCGLLLLWSILQAGCAARLPSSIPVTEERQGDILAHYQAFRQQACNNPIDADILLDLNSFGQHLNTTGFLQIQPPSQLRATVVDTVDRPVFILVAAGDSLTLVNSVKGKAVIGSVASITRESDQPLDLQTEDVISLVAGRFAPPVASLLDVRRDEQSGDLVWLIFSATDGSRHNILFAPRPERIMRHIIDNGNGDILLDIRYSWGEEKNGKCLLPATLTIKGAAIGGEVKLTYGPVVQGVFPENIFELTLPEHYDIKRVD